MSAANADVPESASAANDAVMVVLIVMTSPAHAVVGPKMDAVPTQPPAPRTQRQIVV